ncbi:MAG TPA: helix-turn-helix domain-containing protein [Jatrophihabitantaceae bacterium]
MYGEKTRALAFELRADGLSVAAIHRRLNVSRAAIAQWLIQPPSARRVHDRCFICTGAPCSEGALYTYLLGQYLGDGYLVTRARVPKLRIACADAYPAIAAEVDSAMTTLCGNRVSVTRAIGCSDHATYWTHWPCLLPQHGPGRKHERPIVLADWQRVIVEEHPWSLIRGLIHSDGCRVINRVVVHGKAYEYLRYFFSNESVDIQAIFTAALDQVGVPWRNNRANSVSIARRAGVQLLDEHVGPKR